MLLDELLGRQKDGRAAWTTKTPADEDRQCPAHLSAYGDRLIRDGEQVDRRDGREKDGVNQDRHPDDVAGDRSCRIGDDHAIEAVIDVASIVNAQNSAI